MSAGNFQLWGLLLGSFLGEAIALVLRSGVGAPGWWGSCRMGSTIAWVLWSGLLDSQDWVLCSVVGGAVS